jgi:PAS domain S-box-containing protein
MATTVEFSDQADRDGTLLNARAEANSGVSGESPGTGLSGADLAQVLDLGWKYARDAMVVADCETGLLVEINPATERLTRRLRSELIGKSQVVLHPEDEHAAIRQAFSQATSGVCSTFSGFHVLRRSGDLVPRNTHNFG